MLKIPAVEISAPDKLPEKPVVSVVMMTRNHECFITKAVESVIEQQCDFPMELLIGEDFSTDDTRTLCEGLQTQYPHLIRLLVASANVGITSNFLRLVSCAKGKYIALLEGDDYWVLPEKLQKQVAIMETHPDYSWCGAKTLNRTFWVEEKYYYTLEDTLRRYILHTSSIMFRSEIIETVIRLGKDFWKHWRQSLSIVRLAFPRIIKVFPCRYLNLCLTDPVAASYSGIYEILPEARYTKTYRVREGNNSTN